MTRTRGSALLCLFVVVALLTTGLFAQESTVTGSIQGTVQDASGAIIQNAKVTVKGPTGAKTYPVGTDGRFAATGLPPGIYSLKVETQGFKTTEMKSVEVVTGKASTLLIKLEVGTTTETVEVRADAVAVDTTSTAVGTNLNDTFYESIPMARTVGALFTAAPGVVSGGGTGSQNPSISGASGLENLYVADGVQMNNAAYGGIGVFTSAYGSVGTGINLSFIKEVQVKTAGIEPQYGQAMGGVVQIVTKSGSTAYHGGVSIFAAPLAFKARGKYPDDVRYNKVGYGVNASNSNSGSYDAAAELGGYIPGVKDHVFFYGSFNPTWTIRELYAPGTAGPTIQGLHNWDFRTFSYAGKLTFRLNDSHQIETSIFADPTYTNNDRILKSLAAANNTGYSNMKYGTRNLSGRYTATLSPTWVVNASYAWSHNGFTEVPAYDVFQITDRATNSSSPVVLQGFGLLTNYISNTFAFNVDTSKTFRGFGGSHTIMLGYNWSNPEYNQIKARSGGRFELPANDAAGNPIQGMGSAAGHTADAQWNLLPTSTGLATGITCPTCPLWNGKQVFLKQTRGEYGAGGVLKSHTDYHAIYGNDNWAVNKNVNISAGLRWEQQFITGTDDKYTFTDNWNPRLGVTWDPWGDHKTKLYANFARYTYLLPLDAAIRQLSSELDVQNLSLIPVISGNTISVVPDSAHVIPGTSVSRFISGGGYGFAEGTKMSYQDEFTVGVEREWKGMLWSARYIDRRLKRIIEDVGSLSPEASQFLGANATIANPSKSLDLFVNEVQVIIPNGTNVSAFASQGCSASNTYGLNSAGVASGSADASGNIFTPNAICIPNADVAGALGADGIPDGFVDPKRTYNAFEFELAKGFSHNYMFRLNYRWGKLFGNYEGAFRNDNGQSDPGISSLFDFTAGHFNLLGDQFSPGYLNTDRRHVVNGFFSYTFDRFAMKGMTVGTTIRVQQGVPLNDLGNHPVYNNSGEVPLGGRGSLGRSPVTGTVDLHMEYPVKMTERHTLKFGFDMFNITNNMRPVTIDQANALSQQPVGSNKDYLVPATFQSPFYGRMSLKWEF